MHVGKVYSMNSHNIITALMANHPTDMTSLNYISVINVRYSNDFL